MKNRNTSCGPHDAGAARYYSARTIQFDDEHVGTVFTSGSVVNFLKVKLDRLTKS